MQFSLSTFWRRDLDRYPASGPRILFLALAVIATITLYYEIDILPSVSTLVIGQFHLTLKNYVYLLLVGNLLGAAASIFGSLSDRLGRANLVVYGLLVTSVFTFLLSTATTVGVFLTLYLVLGFIEGILLVATPALVRDFSPRLGRATAMGFWTVGPVGGSFLATSVASATLGKGAAWQSQFLFASIVGAIIFVLALFGLRDLSPALRAQIMTTLKEKSLIEARARGIDVEAALKHPWRQMLRARLLISALGIGLFLLLYFAAVGYFPLYLHAIFGFTTAQANGMVAVFWLVNVIAAISVGIASDRLNVRKPFMLGGTIVSLIAGVLFISRIGQPTSQGLMTFFVSAFGITFAIAYVTWMAGYTETVEETNPALVATGISVWGAALRLVVVVSSVAFAVVVVNPLDGAQWATWWWVCLGGMVLFIPTIALGVGYWTPAQARAAVLAKERSEGLVPEAAVG